jgi:hypothetical protein
MYDDKQDAIYVGLSRDRSTAYCGTGSVAGRCLKKAESNNPFSVTNTIMQPILQVSLQNRQ